MEPRPYVDCHDVWRKIFDPHDPFFVRVNPHARQLFRTRRVQQFVMIELEFSRLLPVSPSYIQKMIAVPTLAGYVNRYLVCDECDHLEDVLDVRVETLLQTKPERTFVQDFGHLMAHLLPDIGKHWLEHYGMPVPKKMFESSVTYTTPPHEADWCTLVLSIDPGIHDYVAFGRRVGEIADALMSVLWGDIHDVGINHVWWDTAMHHPEISVSRLRSMRHSASGSILEQKDNRIEFDNG